MQKRRPYVVWPTVEHG